MKSWKRAVTVALCAASLLVGCGGDCGLKDGEDYTVEDLRGINIPLALLERHEVVTVNVQYTDKNGECSTPVMRMEMSCPGGIMGMIRARIIRSVQKSAGRRQTEKCIWIDHRTKRER